MAGESLRVPGTQDDVGGHQDAANRQRLDRVLRIERGQRAGSGPHGQLSRHGRIRPGEAQSGGRPQVRRYFLRVEGEQLAETAAHRRGLLRKSGQSILVIDKNVDALTRIADRHYIIERGRVVWSGNSQALAASPDVQHRYLGV